MWGIMIALGREKRDLLECIVSVSKVSVIYGSHGLKVSGKAIGERERERERERDRPPALSGPLP